MIVDIGGGNTEIAVISLGGMVIADSIKIAGDEFDEAIIKYMRNQYNLVIGERMSEETKFKIGNVYPDKNVDKMELRGRDAISGLPGTLEIDSIEIRKALKEPVDQIVDAIKHALSKTPPKLSADIIDRSIVITGGGSLLKGLSKYISK